MSTSAQSPGRLGQTVARAKEWKHVVLLAVIILAFLAQPFASDRTRMEAVPHDALLTVALLLAFAVVFESRMDRTIALAAGGTTIACKWIRYFLPGEGGAALAVLHDSALTLFFSFAVVAILRNIIRRRSIRADDVVGSVCGYLLAGGAWAALYSVVDRLVAGSFQVSPSLAMQLEGWHSRHALLDYFSLVTLTTIGYGDVTPVRAPAVSLAWMEAVFGQFYIAVVVAQLVAVHLTQTFRRGDPDSH
ncbi:MAG: potassium channel family protein [Burkholderiales bacterium]